MQCLFVSIQNALFSSFFKIHEHISFKNNFYDFLITCMYETHITNKVHSYVCEQKQNTKAHYNMRTHVKPYMHDKAST